MKLKLLRITPVLLLLMFAVLVSVLSAQPLVDRQVNASLTGSLSAQDTGKPVIDVFKLVDGFLIKFPSDFDVSAKDFVAVLGTETAQALQALGATHISNHGGVVKLSLKDSYEHGISNKADIKVEQESSFKYELETNSVKIGQITGIEVKVSWLLGWMDFKSLSLARDSAGNTVVDAKVHALFKDRDYHTVLGLDGKPLPTPRHK